MINLPPIDVSDWMVPVFVVGSYLVAFLCYAILDWVCLKFKKQETK